MIWKLILLLGVLSVLDGALTLLEVSHYGAAEANPFMVGVIAHGWLAVLAAKGMPVVSLVALPVSARVVGSLAALYGAVIFYHCFWLFT